MDPKEMIKIVVGIDMPPEMVEKYNISDEDFKILCTNSTAVVYQFVMTYINNRKGKEDKKEQEPLPDYYR
jgi:hypothetical protein